ncbi:MAG: porin family protein [Desulfobacteraceae bacterium]|nr:porin family protein [Desulfobacteraceae bacterium]
MKKNLLIISVCVLAIFFSSSAYSAEGLYVSGNIGFAMASDSDITDSTEPVTLTMEYDTGWALGGALGYDFNRFRVEGEISYQTNDIDKVSILGFPFAANGDVSSLAFLINGYFDFVNDSAFTPYISAGLGYAQIDLNDFNVAGSGESDYSDDDSVFAYQVGLGVGYAVTEKVTIDVKYRYFATEDLEFDTTEVEVASHNFLFGVRFNF